MFSGIVIPRKEVTGELDNPNSVIELTQDWLTLCNSLKENTKAPPPSIGKELTQSVYSLAVLFTWEGLQAVGDPKPKFHQTQSLHPKEDCRQNKASEFQCKPLSKHTVRSITGCQGILTHSTQTE